MRRFICCLAGMFLLLVAVIFLPVSAVAAEEFLTEAEYQMETVGKPMRGVWDGTPYTEQLAANGSVSGVSGGAAYGGQWCFGTKWDDYKRCSSLPKEASNSTDPALLCVDYKDPASNGCWRVKKATDDKGILYRYYNKNGQVVFTERVDSMGQ